MERLGEHWLRGCRIGLTALAVLLGALVFASAAAAASSPWEAVFSAYGDSSLWRTGSVTADMQIPMMAGTSPSMAALSGGGYVIAYQSSSGGLFVYDSRTGRSTDEGLGMMAGTNPSVAGLSNGGYQVAFQSNAQQLWTIGSAGWSDTGLGMTLGTSPSITGLTNGGYQIAFQAYGGSLWSIGSAGWTDENLGMMAGTSPSIAGLSNGGYQIAFQSNAQQLWTIGSAGWSNTGLGMMLRTSPSIAGLTGGGYQIAFQSNAQQLWTIGSAGWTNESLGMMTGTSPSIAGLSNGSYQIAFQANTGALWSVGGDGWSDQGLGLNSESSPSIVGLSGSSAADTTPPTTDETVGPGQSATTGTVSVTATDQQSGVERIQLISSTASGSTVLATRTSACVGTPSIPCPSTATANFTYDLAQAQSGIIGVTATDASGNTSDPDYYTCDPGDTCAPIPASYWNSLAANDTTDASGNTTYAPDTSGGVTVQPKQGGGVPNTAGGSLDPQFQRAFQAGASSRSLRTCLGGFRPFQGKGFPVANIWFRRGKYGKLYWDFYLTNAAQAAAEYQNVLVSMPTATVNGAAINPPYSPHYERVTYDFHASMQNYATYKFNAPPFGTIHTGDTLTFFWFVATAPAAPSDFSVYLACKVPPPGVG